MANAEAAAQRCIVESRQVIRGVGCPRQKLLSPRCVRNTRARISLQGRTSLMCTTTLQEDGSPRAGRDRDFDFALVFSTTSACTSCMRLAFASSVWQQEISLAADVTAYLIRILTILLHWLCAARCMHSYTRIAVHNVRYKL